MLKAGPIFQQPFPGMSCCQKMGEDFSPAASKFAGKPFQQDIWDSHSLLELGEKRPFVHNSVCLQFGKSLFAILAECSRFCLRSFSFKFKRKSITLLIGRGERGTKSVNKMFVNELAFPDSDHHPKIQSITNLEAPSRSDKGEVVLISGPQWVVSKSASRVFLGILDFTLFERGRFKNVISWFPWLLWFPVFLRTTPCETTPLWRCFL